MLLKEIANYHGNLVKRWFTNMGLLFEKSEKKVAHTMTVVEMTRKYESEIAKLEEKNQNKSKKADKLDHAKTQINARRHNLMNSVHRHPNNTKRQEIDVLNWVWEVLK